MEFQERTLGGEPAMTLTPVWDDAQSQLIIKASDPEYGNREFLIDDDVSNELHGYLKSYMAKTGMDFQDAFSAVMPDVIYYAKSALFTKPLPMAIRTGVNGVKQGDRIVEQIG